MAEAYDTRHIDAEVHREVKRRQVNRMKAARYKMGYTQSDMADMLGVTQATYNRIENQIDGTSDEVLDQIAAILHLKRKNLFKKARVD